MGALTGFISSASSKDIHVYHDLNGEYNHEVKELLQASYALAEKILISEKILLLELSGYLSDERIIKKEAIEKMVRKFGSQDLKNMAFIENGNYSYYRAVLKQQISEKIMM